jgi:hypothetical protein
MSRIVTIGLQLQGAQQVAAGMQAVAQQTQAAAQAATVAQQRYQQLQQQIAQVQTALPGLGLGQIPAAQALVGQLNRQANQAQQQALGYQLGVLNAPPGGIIGSPPGGGSGYQNPLAGTGFARLAQPLFLLHAFGQTVEGFGKSLDKLATEELNAAQATDMLARRTAESIPILGGLVRGIGDIIDAASGVNTARAGGLRAVAIAERSAQLGGAISTANLRGAVRQNEIDRMVGGATTSAAAAAAFQAGLTPDRIRGYYPEVGFGLATHATGHLAMQADLAAGTAASAATSAAAERARYEQLQQATGGENFDARIADQQRAADRAQTEANRLHLAVQNQPGYFSAAGAGNVVAALGTTAAVGMAYRFGGYGTGQAAEAALRPNMPDDPGRLQAASTAATAEALTQQVKLKELLASKTQALGALEKQRQTTLEAETRAIQAQASLADSRLAKEKDRLGIITEQVERAKSGAVSAALKSPLEAQADLELARFGRGNWDALTPEQRQNLVGHPIMGPFFRKQAEEVGLQNPAVQQQIGEFGAPAGAQFGGLDFGGLQKQQQEIQTAVVKAFAEAQTETAKGIEAASKAAGTEFGKLLVQLNQAGLDAVKTEILEAINKQRIQGGKGG